jgi:hypothetical protein
MSARAVRAWLKSTLAPAGLAVFDAPLVLGATGDSVSFQRFPRQSVPLTFGSAGALYESTYTPSLLVWLINPSSVADQQTALDGYVDALLELLIEAPTPATLTDAVTGEVSKLAYVGPTKIDPAPSNTLTASVLVPTLVEYATRAA